MENKETIKSFIERHTSTTLEGKKQIDVVTALNELDVRDRTRYKQIEEIQSAIGGCATMIEELNKQLEELKPKIDIVSPLEAKNLLKGK